MNIGMMEALLTLRDTMSPALAMAARNVQTHTASMAAAGAALSAGVTVPLAGLAYGAIQAAGSFQQTRVAFETMLGSAEKASTFLKDMEQFAAATPFQFDDLVTASKRMLALGFTAEQIKPTLTAIGDAAAGLGGGAEMINGVTLALGQMSAKGKVSAQEMNQLAERGIPAWKILSSQIGVSIPEAMKLAEKGAISSAVAVPAILAGMNEKFGGMMAKQSQTLLGQWSTVKDQLSFMLKDLGTALLPVATSIVEAFNKVLPYLQAMTRAFNDLSPGVKGAIIGLAALAAAIGPAILAASGLAFGISAIIAAGPVLVPLLALLAGAALALAAAWLAGGQSIEGVVTLFYNGVAAMADITAVVVSRITLGFQALFEVMGKIPGAVGEPFRNAAFSLREFNLNLQNTGANARTEGKNVVAGFTAVKTEVKTAIDNAKALAEAFKNGVAPATKLTKEELEKAAKAAAEQATETKKLNYALDGQAFAIEQANELLDQYLRVHVDLSGIIPITQKDIDDLNASLGEIPPLDPEVIGSQIRAGEAALKAAGDTDKFGTTVRNVAQAAVMFGQAFGGSFEQVGAGLTMISQGWDEYQEAMDKAVTGQDKVMAKIGLASQMANAVGGLMANSANKTMAYAGAALQGAAAGAKLGATFGPIGAGIGAVGGAILGLFNKKKQLREEMKKLKDAFIDQMGGLDALKAKAAEAGVSLDKMMAAKNKETLLKAIDDVKGKLQTWDDAHVKLNEAVERYGLTISELGPKFAEQKLNEQAGLLLQDYELLKASGADMNAVIAKMAPSMQDYINSAIAAGQSVPQQMRPMIEQMIQSGLLLDANGQAFGSVEAAGITFAQTMDQQFSTLIEKIDAMVNALMGVGNVKVPAVTIPYRYRQEGGGPPNMPEPENPTEGHATGTGFKNFGSGTLAVLHGRERVQTESQARAEMASAGATADEMRKIMKDLGQDLRKGFRDAALKAMA